MGLDVINNDNLQQYATMSEEQEQIKLAAAAHKAEQRKRMRLCLSRCLIFLLLSVAVVAVLIVEDEENNSNSGGGGGGGDGRVQFRSFLAISDLHYDPTITDTTASSATFCRSANSSATTNTTGYNTPFGRPGCDSPHLLVETAIREMARVDGEQDRPSDFVLLMGDSAAHGLSFNSTLKLSAIETVAELLRESFPNTPVFPALGNNDLPLNYNVSSVEHKQWYSLLLNSTSWLDLVVCPGCSFVSAASCVSNKTDIETTFRAGGYYRACASSRSSHPFHVVALNSLYFSVRAGTAATTVAIASAQLQWFLRCLQEAQEKGKQLIVFSHIPPGVDPFISIQDANDPQTAPVHESWVDGYSETYFRLVNEYAETIHAQLFGHYHKDDFKLIPRMRVKQTQQKHPEQQQSVTGVVDTVSLNTENTNLNTEFAHYLLINPGISPIYNNNAAFRIYDYSTTSTATATGNPNNNNPSPRPENYRQFFLDQLRANVGYSSDTDRFSDRFQIEYSFNATYGGLSGDNRPSLSTFQHLHTSLVDVSNNTVWNSYFAHRTSRHFDSKAAPRYWLYCVISGHNEQDVRTCLHRHPNNCVSSSM